MQTILDLHHRSIFLPRHLSHRQSGGIYESNEEDIQGYGSLPCMLTPSLNHLPLWEPASTMYGKETTSPCGLLDKQVS